MNDQLIGELSVVVSLKNHPGWLVIQRDAELAYNTAASAWVDIWDDKQLFELRVKQCASRQIMTLMDLYESRLKEAQAELIAEQNKDIIIPLDVDNNPPDINEEDNGE